MIRFGVAIALAGCGRIGFDPTAGQDATQVDGVLMGHDEDGDGVPDSIDTCPHLVGAQTDGDGDGVGDLCDPRPGMAGDRIAGFYTMRPGDQPFVIDTANTEGTFTQDPDGLRLDGPDGPNGNLFGLLAFPIVLANARVGAGFDVLAIRTGSNPQSQIAFGVKADPPLYFVEVNQILPTFSVASITHFDGTNYMQTDPQTLASTLHTGALTMQTTQQVGIGIDFIASWPGEPYTCQVRDAVYQGGTQITMNLNNLDVVVRYLVIITSP